MTKIIVNEKDEIIMKVLHYFITEEDYKPIILTGVQNEIWLENFNKDLKLIRININHIHNNEQFEVDLRKANFIMKNIKKKTFSFKMNLLNILIDANEEVDILEEKNIQSIKIRKILDLKKNKLVNSVFPGLKQKINTAKSDPVEFIKMTEQLNEKSKTEEKKYNKLFKNSKPVVTYALIAINVFIYFIMRFGFYNEFVYYGANTYLFIKSYEFYRLLTSTFLHANIYHIFFNMYALYVIGPQVEKYFGRAKFVLIYLLSGLMGSIFSCVFMSENAVSIGASGAIFGLFGSLAYFTYKNRATLNHFLRSSILPTIVINLILGFLLPNVDSYGHIGGLLGGIILSIILGYDKESEKNTRMNYLISFILMLAFLIYIIMVK